MANRGKTAFILLLLVVIAGGWWLADYESKAAERRDTERRAAVEAIQRALGARDNLPAADGAIKREDGRAAATGGLADLGSTPSVPEDTVVNYAVSPDTGAYFACTELERSGAVYANRHGTFDGPPESCRPDADPAAVDYVLDAMMTSEGARAFLRSNPEFVSKGFIQRKCAATADDGQLQGCFAADRIYLIDLPEREIRPEVSVTAAHEMLHAVWERLGEDERQRLTSLLEDLIERNPDLREKVASYDEISRINEAHSAAGTEVKDVGDALERHYAKYLRDRGAIVRRHLEYERVLDDLRVEIERLKREFRAFEARGERLLASGDIAAYNEFVADYNARAPGMVADINEKVDRFNRLTEHTRPDSKAATVEAR